jgi:sterol desaturase/sphingolipid hydroxylase (fatty acid hydroxylase superfamily)
MHYLEFLTPRGPLLAPFIFIIGLFGLRYLVIALIAFFIARAGWGRAHTGAPVTFNTYLNVRRELLYSLLTVIVFGMVFAFLQGWQWIKASQVYYHVSDYPLWWFLLSIPVMVILHDTFFYWLHRAMHTRLLFKLMHKIHHQSVHPTSFAAYSFHPTEALGEALIVVAIIYIIPTHPLAFVIFQTFSTAYNVYGHCGREFYPAATPSHWLGRWLNTSTAHAVHHSKGRYNYGLYFMGWDRLMKTVDPQYK